MENATDDGKRYVVLSDKLGTFSKGAIVASVDLRGQLERHLRHKSVREATAEEIKSGVATFSEDRTAAAVSLENQIREMQEHIELMSRQNQDLEGRLAEYRRAPGDDRTAHVVSVDDPPPEGAPAGDGQKSGTTSGEKGDGKPNGAPPPPPPPSGTGGKK